LPTARATQTIFQAAAADELICAKLLGLPDHFEKVVAHFGLPAPSARLLAAIAVLAVVRSAADEHAVAIPVGGGALRALVQDQPDDYFQVLATAMGVASLLFERRTNALRLVRPPRRAWPLTVLGAVSRSAAMMSDEPDGNRYGILLPQADAVHMRQCVLAGVYGLDYAQVAAVLQRPVIMDLDLVNTRPDIWRQLVAALADHASGRWPELRVTTWPTRHSRAGLP
jgi:hypothetical protein